MNHTECSNLFNKPAQALVSVNLIFQKDHQILLSLRENTGYGDGYYNLVAGKVDVGEIIEKAAVREAREEVGVTLLEEDLTFFMLMQTLKIKEPYHTALHIFFLCKKWEGTIMNKEPNKCGDLAFFPHKKLPANTTQLTQKVVRYLTHPAEHKYYEYLDRVI